LLVKLPVPLPLVVLELPVVGFDEVLQQTPLAVTVKPPSDMTLPPQTALFEVIEDTELVDTIGEAPPITYIDRISEADNVLLYMRISSSFPFVSSISGSYSLSPILIPSLVILKLGNPEIDVESYAPSI
jgi:hypothetical protein